MPDMNAYLSFSVRFLLAFGLVFELPMALLVLTRAGIIDTKVLSSQRRYAILLIFILGAVIAPPDILSQVLLAIPLIGLYEVSILLARIFGKKPDPILTEGTN
jgi:sec-independent protein translocase protein TatC